MLVSSMTMRHVLHWVVAQDWRSFVEDQEPQEPESPVSIQQMTVLTVEKTWSLGMPR